MILSEVRSPQPVLEHVDYIIINSGISERDWFWLRTSKTKFSAHTKKDLRRTKGREKETKIGDRHK